MTKPVRPNQFAERDIADELGWYYRESPELAERLWAEIQHAVAILSDYPASGGRILRFRGKRSFRRFPLRHFPFFVVYREHPSYVEVVALAHTSRRPDYWHARLK